MEKGSAANGPVPRSSQSLHSTSSRSATDRWVFLSAAISGSCAYAPSPSCGKPARRWAIRKGELWRPASAAEHAASQNVRQRAQQLLRPAAAVARSCGDRRRQQLMSSGVGKRRHHQGQDHPLCRDCTLIGSSSRQAGAPPLHPEAGSARRGHASGGEAAHGQRRSNQGAV